VRQGVLGELAREMRFVARPGSTNMHRRFCPPPAAPGPPRGATLS
jgi:hypothetical protein